MNICYIFNSALPSKNASSLQTAKLCENISRQGHLVTLILPNTGLKKNVFNHYNIKHKFKLKRISYFKKFPVGINYYLFTFWAILTSNIKFQDLYITRNFFTSFILSILNKQHILEVHDDIQIEGRIVKLLIKYLGILNFNTVIKIVTTTNTLKKRYESYGISRKKIKVLHNASSLNGKFNVYRKKKFLKIGYFGSIFKSRGIEMIVKLSKLDMKNKYYVYGGSIEDIKKIKKNLTNKNLFIFPYVPYAKIDKKISQTDVCILPYTSKITVSGNVGDISKYTSPLKIFDYMKLGKLIISSNLPVLREILKDKHNSILIKRYNDEKEWLKVILSISKNLNKYDKMRKNAFNYANKFDSNWRVKELLNV
tara:strand:- start:4438 stop:5538 length:1101 start_codon:yes stop_codon:yes gene_type:complete